jgi:hypothetical protein
MLDTTAKLTAATAFLALTALGAFALPSGAMRPAGTSLDAPSGIEQASWRRGRCFRQCIAGRRFRSCQRTENKENCCSDRCRPRR